MTKHSGAYRRAVVIKVDDGRAYAEMEDDIHHFAVTLEHDGARITKGEPHSIRTPWTTCPGAGAAIVALKGRALTTPLRFALDAERVAHCTHMLDLANLAIAHALTPGFRRLYRIEVDYEENYDARAWLDRDGERLFTWRIEKGAVIDETQTAMTPEERIAHAVSTGADEAEIEALVVMRRGMRISGARLIDLDAFATVAELGQPPTCFTLLEGVRDKALRVKGSVRDFSGEGAWPLDADEAV